MSAPPEVLIIGTGPLARCTAETLTRQRRGRVVGYLRLLGEPDVAELPEAPVLGPGSDLERLLVSHPVQEVYVAGDVLRYGAALQAAVLCCERLGMPFALPASPLRLERAWPASPGSGDGYVHYLTHESRRFQRALKRLLDVGVSALALWLLAPLLLLVAALIKLTSRGPVLFRQTRVGLHGRPFTMLKFRSMRQDAEELQEALLARNELSGPVFKMREDPRVTSLGRFLRKYSIDELPQLVNVLRGDMSLVGPRPPLAREVAQYETWQRRRLSMRPGLTCIWQVSGRNQISFREWMYLDMRYIDHWSLGQDLALLARTVPVVLTGRGAS